MQVYCIYSLGSLDRYLNQASIVTVLVAYMHVVTLTYIVCNCHLNSNRDMYIRALSTGRS
jgi:hypothetical protein